MGRFNFAVAVAVTSLVLVAILGVIAVVATPLGALITPSAQASGPWPGGPWFGMHGPGGPGFNLPPELQGLGDLPPAEQFAHFTGVQANLKDKNNQPFTVNVVPGVATAVSTSDLTITANDGITRTFTISDATVVPGRFQSGSQGNQLGIVNGDQVIVVTFNNDTTAKAIMPVGQSGFWHGGFGPPPWVRSMWFHR